MKRQTRILLFLVAAGLPLAAAQQTPQPPAAPANAQAGMTPAPPTQYSGRGTVEQLNYDRGGSVNGFLMSNGVLVFTPPMGGDTVVSTMRKGSTVVVQGMDRQTLTGRKVVDAQSLKVGEQTIVFAMGGGPRPGPGGPGGAPPPPPPPPPPAAPPR